jgi:hypothetical protein
MADQERVRGLLEKLRQLERREDQIREQKEDVIAQLDLAVASAPDVAAVDEVETVRRVGWRAIHARQRAMVTIDHDRVDLPLRLALVFFALLKLAHGAGGDPLAYRSALEIGAWIADHRPNGVRPSLHCVESYISKLRKWPRGRFALLIEGDKRKGWRLASRTPVTIAGEP